MSQLNQKKIINAWAMYDWANSVFSLTIKTAIFPIYYEVISRQVAVNDIKTDSDPIIIEVFGREVVNSAAYSWTLSVAFLIVAIISPLLSGIADYGGIKKKMMQFFVLLGSVSCMLLFFSHGNTIVLALFFLMLGSIGFQGSLVFYNAFLPEVCTEDRMDKVSAKGYALGYIGSVILLIINLIVISNPEWFFPVASKAEELVASGVSPASAYDDAIGYYKVLGIRLSFVMVGLWWIGFSQITFRNLPKEHRVGKLKNQLFSKGFKELKTVFIRIRTTLPYTKKYILAFLFASMGVQTVMYMASLFGAQELNMESDKLILVLLIIQIVAVGGAYLFAWMAQKLGSIRSLIISTIIWLLVCFSAYYVADENQFYLLAFVVGLVMGGTQSLFRSTYAKLIPEDTHDHASFFSFYDVTEKVAVVIGTLIFGYINQLAGNMRASALFLSCFFLIGLLILFFIRNLDNELNDPNSEAH